MDNTLDENAVLTMLVKTGLPIYGSHEERLERLYRNGIMDRPDVQRFQEVHKPHVKAAESKPAAETPVVKPVGKPKGRPRKNEVKEKVS